VFYGHLGVFVFATHEAMAILRDDGYRVEMLPGISAEDCLYADLSIDPATHGCQVYEATDFLIRRRKIDPAVPVILWQVGWVTTTRDLSCAACRSWSKSCKRSTGPIMRS